MLHDRVSVDGVVGGFGDFVPGGLLGANFVYQKIAVFGRTIMGLEWAAEVLRGAWHALYGGGADLDDLSREILALLDANRYPVGGGMVAAVYLIPRTDGRSMRMIDCEKQLVHRDFALNTGLRGVVVPCDTPFEGCRTAASLSAQSCAGLYARRRGGDVAICENGGGMQVSIGDSPLFAAVGGQVAVAPGADCVERRMGIEACRRAGLELCERLFTSADLKNMDEIFAFVPHGIASIGELDGRSLPHSLAANLLRHMPRS